MLKSGTRVSAFFHGAIDAHQYYIDIYQYFSCY